jgi:hypothetical protein
VFVIKLITLIALLVSVAWLGSSPGWRPITATLTSFIAFLAQEIRDQKKLRGESDQSLFREFIEALPSSSGLIAFLTEHDFGHSFGENLIIPVDEFYLEWRVPERQFRDRKLGKAFVKLVDSVDRFRHVLANNTFSLEQGRQGVPPEWKLENPERFEKTAAELNESATDVLVSHREFVELAKRRLDV